MPPPQSNSSKNANITPSQSTECEFNMPQKNDLSMRALNDIYTVATHS